MDVDMGGKDWLFPYEKIVKSASIILYGAGDVGQAYYSQLSLNGYCKIVHWVDINYKDYLGFGLDVEPVDVISESDYDYVVIAVYDSEKARGIREFLLNMGVLPERIVWSSSERFVYRGNVEEQRLVFPAIECTKKVLHQRGIRSDVGYGKGYLDTMAERARTGFIIPRLVVELTTACTLKCKHCNNLIPHLHPRNVDVEKVKKDLKIISDASDDIVIVELIGGEPFLYPHLKEILDFVIGLENVFEIEITTNGTIVPGKELIESLKDPKAVLHVSHYESSGKIHELEKVLFDNHIRYVCMEELEWIDSGGVEDRHRTDAQIRDEYWKCGPGYFCKTLFDGRIYACARSASLYELGVLDDPSGYIEVGERESFRSELRNFWLKITDRACNYCDAADSRRIIKAGEQID